VVSDHLGHEKIETTLRHYAHHLPCAQERMVSTVQALFGGCPVVAPEAGENTSANENLSIVPHCPTEGVASPEEAA
jgi:hypothetical protein